MVFCSPSSRKLSLVGGGGVLDISLGGGGGVRPSHSNPDPKLRQKSSIFLPRFRHLTKSLRKDTLIETKS